MFDNDSEFADSVAENDLDDHVETYIDPDKDKILQVYSDILKKLVECDTRAAGSSFYDNLYVMLCLLPWFRVKRGL